MSFGLTVGPEQILGAHGLFSVFSREDHHTLAAQGRVIAVEPHTNIVIEGDLSGGLYALLAGEAGVYRTQANGQLLLLASLQAGAVFGEWSLMERAPRTATVVATSLCRVFCLSGEAFNAFLEAQPVQSRLEFYRGCIPQLLESLRAVRADLMATQQLLWKARVPGPSGSGPAP